MTFSGVVLAGGASRRMGQDKAALVLGGETLLARVVRLLRAATPEVFVIGPAERTLLVPGIPVVPDAQAGTGPLGAIATALAQATTDYVFVAACDMPFLRPGLVRYLAALASDFGVTVPRSARGLEPLHAVYARSCLPVIAAMLAERAYAVGGLCARVPTRIVEPEEWSAHDPAGLSIMNVNTPAEWRAALDRAGTGDLAGESFL
ncbi:MAG TPA: molybdenum cofactor guanylyltransferase [Ktedonobacterales bacterium]|jgi:molybdopterin-guanine dinucleotide biosynthesis protein A